MRFYDKRGDLHRFYVGSLMMPVINKIKKSPTAAKVKQTVKSVKADFIKVRKPDTGYRDHHYTESDIIDIEPDDVDGM